MNTPEKIEVVVTYLEMTHAPGNREPRHRLEKLAILRAHKPTVSFYRYLYNTVGDTWLWYDRRKLMDDELLEIIHNEKVGVYVLYVDGVPAGYAELDRRIENEIELAYFGLVPEFIGRGLGTYFLDWSVNKAWSYSPQRVWVHTCTLDHPQALATYQKVGFEPYKRETITIDNPRPALVSSTQNKPV